MSERRTQVPRTTAQGLSGTSQRRTSRPGERTRRRDPRATSGQRGRGRTGAGRPRQQQTDPLLLLVGAAAIGIVLGALVCFLIMRPQISAARSEAAEAASKVETLTSQVESLKKTIEENEAATSTSTSTSASSSKSSAKDAGGVESPWTDKAFTSGDPKLDEEVKEFVDANCGTSKTRSDAALSMYKALAWSDYVERDDAQEPSGASWRITYARQYFDNEDSGNCYEFAAALMYCLRYMGYDDAKAEGILIELQSGSWGDHGVVFVTDDEGVEKMCDTARGVDGWMIDLDVYNYTVEDFETA